MHECLLCKRNIKTSNDTFGNGCVRNIYSFLGMSIPRKVMLREPTLYKNVMKINNIHNINTYQKIWLTDRYLTGQYLNKIPYGNYSKLTKQINTDIQSINQIENNEKPKSAKNMSLKQAYDLYKKATKFTEGIEKLKKGNFTDEESIKLLISSFSFIFNMRKNSNQYEKSSFKAMQFAFWQTVIEIGGKYAEFDISAGFLQHSLEKEPNDLLIKEFIFDSSNNKNFPMAFSESDLYFSLNNVSLYLKAKKENKKWNLEINLHDRYDYTEFKNIDKYYKDTKSIPKSIFSSTLYNLAHYSVKFGVMKEYNIDIQFKMNDDFEVIDI